MRSLKLSNKNKGFTLLEIIVSIAVIGILLSISVVSYGNWKQKTTIAQAKSDLLSISTAFENYRNSNNSYPKDVTKLANFKTSSDLILDGGSRDGDYFCINATTKNDSSISYYKTSLSDEVKSGKCPIRYWEDIAMGSLYSCAIAINKQVYCWGNGFDGRLGNNSATNSSIPNPAAVSQGAMTSLEVKSITTGYSHTCVIGSDNKAYCWGNGLYGRLGNENTTSSSIPVAVSQGAMVSLEVKSISAGYMHTCAIGSDDKAYCWGNGLYGRLGNENTIDSLIPVAVSQGAMASLKVKSISVGYTHTCVIGFDDKAYCWGQNYAGHLGNNNTINSSIPVAVSQGAMTSLEVKSISAGSTHTCALGFDSKAYCWGYGAYGRLGNDNITNSSIPVAVSQGAMTSLEVKSISAGNYNTCALGFDSKAYCWGGNQEGNLGDNTVQNRQTPSLVINNKLKNIELINTSKFDNSSCIINSGNLFCFGNNSAYRLGFGYGDFLKKSSKIQQGAMPSLNIGSLSLGNQHTCATSLDNRLYCWGYGDFGQLGNNTSFSNFNPTAAVQANMQAMQVRTVSVGFNHTCVIDLNNTPYCWGWNVEGQLGNNKLTLSGPTPVAVLQGSMASLNVKAISSAKSGGSHTCAIGFDDKAYCWGINNSGQLGNSSTVNSSVPTAVSQGQMASMSVKAISAGASHTCAIGFDDKAYCWGSNENNQLSESTISSFNIPMIVNEQKTSQIKTGVNTTCTIDAQGLAYCRGNNQRGQLGTSLNSIFSHNTPQLALPPQQ